MFQCNSRYIQINQEVTKLQTGPLNFLMTLHKHMGMVKEYHTQGLCDQGHLCEGLITEESTEINLPDQTPEK